MVERQRLNRHNQLWPLCDEFDFFAYHYFLKSKGFISFRVMTRGMEPLIEIGQMIRLDYRPQLIENLSNFDVVVFWDNGRIDYAYIQGIQGPHSAKVVDLRKTNDSSFHKQIKTKYLLGLCPHQFSFWQRLKLYLKGLIHKF